VTTKLLKVFLDTFAQEVPQQKGKEIVLEPDKAN
jgi:hypothetical protein